MDLPLDNIRLVVQHYNAALVNFTQHILAIPSLPGHEGEVAKVIRKEMIDLGYDAIWTDQAGNVIGKIDGGDGPSILLNGHMDHVDAGRNDEWPYPPFGGQIVNGELWGRASVDMKGPVACMIYAASLFKHLQLKPPGDVYVTVAVMEEVGGIGTQHLVTQVNAQAAVCGEPSSNTLRRGHRGRVELAITLKGKSAHASAPHLGLNPHYAAASFLNTLSNLNLAQDDTLGASTVVPTLYFTDQSSPNVIPEYVYLTLDWRFVPQESPQEIVEKTEAFLNSCLAHAGQEEYQASVAVKSQQFTTYTGLTQIVPAVFPSYLLPESDRFVQAAHKTLVDVFGRDDGIDVWRFATDGGHLVKAGIPTVGFGPGNETLAHTTQERISLTQMEEAVIGYVALIIALGEAA